jgi:serine/threonine-protein kinase
LEHVPSSKSVHIVGRYALYDAIAAGGMATVHYGRLLGPVGFSRTVAVKRLHAQFARDPEFVSMFLDEARLAARIRHPNVVPTLDVVATGGELFLVMEYVAGESLSRLVRTAAGFGTIVPPRIVIAIMCGVLRGLHAAHEATNERGEPLGIVHRDVSPQNVLVGIDGQARVLDFGVAKAAGRLQTTRDGKLKGKLAYMAPEQLRGKAVDRRVDIFAAATVLWEALTGRRLFRGDNEGAIVTKILEGSVEPPSSMVSADEADEASRTIIKSIDDIVLKGLALQVADRYETARDMAIALERVAPPAGVAEVSEWVEHFAKDILVTRAQQVAEIESNSSVGPPNINLIPEGDAGRDDDSSSDGRLSRHSSPEPSGRKGLGPVSPDLSTISVASHAQLPAFRRGRGAWIVGAVSGLVALLILFAGVHALRSTDPPQHETVFSSPGTPPSVPSGAPAASGAPVATPPPTATPEPAAVAATAPIATPVKAAVALPAAAANVARPVAHPAAQHAAPPAAPAGKLCDPPFTYDAQGLKHFKPECF